MFSYLPEGTSLRFFAPSFKFNVSSNMGIPFIFDLDSIASTSYEDGVDVPKSVRVSLTKDSVIARADDPEAEASSIITVDNTSFPDLNASDIFKTTLRSINASYTFRAPERGSLLASEEQFIDSRSRIRMTASAQLPIWLDKGSVITYADTLDFDSLDEEDYDYITNADLIFTYTSCLPIGFDVTITLLDKNKSVIAVANPDKYKYEIKAAPVDDDGRVNQNNPLKDEFRIGYDSSLIDDLKKAKHLKIDVKAVGATPNSKIKIADSDKLSIKVGLRTEGGLTVKPKL